MISRAVFLFAALFALSACRDDTLTDLAGGVTGQVCNPVTGRPAPGAVVTAQFTNPKTKKTGEKSATADDTGFFKLGGLPVTAVNLHVVAADSFINDIADVAIEALKDTPLTDPACRDVPQDPGTGEVVGQICNRHTGDYVTNGTVTVQLADGTPLSTQTNPTDGSFVLDGVPAGEQIVYVRGDGFQKTFQVNVVEGQQTLLDQQDVTCAPYDSLTTGMIVGSLCAADGSGVSGPLAGAHVFVVNGIDGIQYEDETISDGSFTIAGIPTPQGDLQVRAEKGGFIFTWDHVAVQSITVAPDGTNLTATASTGCQQLVPDDGRKYLVVKGIYDRIEHVLQRMGLEPDLIEGNPIDFGHDWTQDAFGVKATLETYDAVFINCGVDEGPYTVGGLNATVKKNLREYVQGGGSLYVSDWAYDIIEQVWPEKINFLGDDTENSKAEHGAGGSPSQGPRTYHASVTEQGLEQYLGASSLDVEFKFDNFAVISQVAPGVTTYLLADEKYHVNGTTADLPATPMTVGFNDGLGRVIFTSFHQEQDASALCTVNTDCSNGLSCIDNACTAQLDDAEDQVLRYLVFSL